MLACFAAGCPSRNLLEHLLRTTDAKQRVRAPASGLWSLLEMRLTFSQGALLGPKDESGTKNARRCRRTPHCVSPLRQARPASSSALLLLAKRQSSHVNSVPLHLAAGVCSVCAGTLCRPASAQPLLQVLPSSPLSAARSVSVPRNPSAELLQFGPDLIHRRGRHPWTSSMPTCSSLMTRRAARRDETWSVAKLLPV